MCLASLSTSCILEGSTVSERSLAVNSAIYLSKQDAVVSLLHPPHSAVHTCDSEIKTCSRVTRLFGALEFTQRSESHGQRSPAGSRGVARVGCDLAAKAPPPPPDFDEEKQKIRNVILGFCQVDTREKEKQPNREARTMRKIHHLATSRFTAKSLAHVT